jgi:uncharacterized phiE125 gp8 family phage protein
MTLECYGLKLITAPAVLPVSVADVRTWGRITTVTGEFTEAVLEDRIKAAVELAETFTGLSFIHQTWSMFLDGFPAWEICLPKPPWDSITWIKYYDTSDVQQTMDSTDYIFDAVQGRLTPAISGSWPATSTRINSVDIKFVSGFGATGADCPAQVRECLLEIVEDRLKNRGGMFKIAPGTLEKLQSLWTGRI